MMKTPCGIYLGGAVVPIRTVFLYGLAVVWLHHAVMGQILTGCTATDCLAGLQSCGVTVTVDSQASQNCSQTMPASMSLSGRACNSLQDVLNSIGSNVTTHAPGDCISVNIAAGDYIITNAVTITQNVILRGEFGPLTIDPATDICPATTDSNPPQPGNTNTMRQATLPPPTEPTDPNDPSDCTTDATFTDLFQVRVTFDLRKPNTSDLQDPYYALVFTGSDAVAISGIMFSNGPGILGFEDISFVSVENCSFR